MTLAERFIDAGVAIVVLFLFLAIVVTLGTSRGGNATTKEEQKGCVLAFLLSFVLVAGILCYYMFVLPAMYQ